MPNVVLLMSDEHNPFITSVHGHLDVQAALFRATGANRPANWHGTPLQDSYDARPDIAAELQAELRAICDPETETRKAHEFEEKQLRAIRESGA